MLHSFFSVLSLLTQPSNHHDVKDFSWIRPTPSPNWSMLPESNLIGWAKEINDHRALPTAKTSEWVREVVIELFRRAGIAESK
jgi:hypothetical protein